MFVKGVMLLYIGIIDLFSLLYKNSFYKKIQFVYPFYKWTCWGMCFGDILKIFLYIHVHLFQRKKFHCFFDGHILRMNFLAHKINVCLSLVEYVKVFFMEIVLIYTFKSSIWILHLFTILHVVSFLCFSFVMLLSSSSFWSYKLSHCGLTCMPPI